MHSKEDLEDLCGDLFAIRVIAQSTGVPSTVRKQLRGSLKALLYKSSRYHESEGTATNKKQKLEEKSHTEEVVESEEAAKSETVNETENNKLYSKDETKADPMEVSVSEEPVKPQEEKLEPKKEGESETATAKVTEKKCVKKRENTPSTASEDETETDKPAEVMEVTVAPSDEEEDTGLLTACGPVVAASTLAAKTQTQKEEKDTERDSSSDDGANSIYSVHKNSSSSTTAKTGERLTVTLAKNSNKKTANDRLVCEFEKRCKMLHTMETYIRSILALMQKDEEHANNNEQSGDTDSEERQQLSLPMKSGVPASDVGIMSDTGSSDDDQPLVLPKSPSATPPPLAPLSRGDCGLTISKVTSTATLAKAFNPFKNVDSLSIDEEEEDDDEEEEESDKQSDLNKSSSSAGSSLLANGEEVSPTTQIRTKVASIMSNVAKANAEVKKQESDSYKEADVISSPASPTEILTSATVDPTQL